MEQKSSEELSGLITSSEDNIIHFPLPPQDDDTLCRDEFLKKILPRTLEKVEYFETSNNKRQLKIREVEALPDNIEGLGILKIQKENRFRTATQSRISSFYRLSLTREEKIFIYRKFLQRFQVAALEFLSVRMKKQIDTILKVWPGDLTDIPHKLFNWSVEEFIHRQQVNQLYLEVITMERSKHELNCAKFCTDLSEIIRLLNAIREDYSNNVDICKSSIQLLKDSNYEVTSNWSEELEKLREVYDKLVSKSSLCSDRRLRTVRLSTLTLGMHDHVAVLPIELRYRINWMRSSEEQFTKYLENRENALENEKDALTDRINQDNKGYRLDEFIYQAQIDQFKSSIIYWQEKLDLDLEAVELQCNITRNRLNKAKDDFKMYNDRVIMFRERIQEVNEIIAKEEFDQSSQSPTSEVQRPQSETLSTKKGAKSKINKKKTK